MNYAIQLILAQGIIKQLSESSAIAIHELKNGKIQEKGIIDNFWLVQQAVDAGLPLLLPIEFNDRQSVFVDFLICYDNSEKMIDYVCSKLTKEDISNLSGEMVNDIYRSSEHNIKLLETFFLLGFDFIQGKFYEYDKAMVCDIGFFELCLKMKPDFQFTFLYEDELTLDELMFEEISYCKDANRPKNEIEKKQNLYNFLKKVKQSEELKNELDNNLNSHKNLSKTIKKI
jgi:hypothetical protein